MADILSRGENWWKTSRILPWILVLIGTGLALWVGFTQPSPGVSIGILAAVAGIMSVRPEMHFAEKLAWIVLLVTFTILEVHAIHVGDRKNEEVREAQNMAFDDIANGLKVSIQAAKSQYESTIGHVDGVLRTTQSVAGLARENLEDITGGNTYAYVTPQNFIGAGSTMFLTITTKGKHNLTSVTIAISRVSEQRCPTDNGDPWENGCSIKTDYGVSEPIDLGTMLGNSSGIVRQEAKIAADINGMGEYVVDIHAQNGVTAEFIWLRKAAVGNGIAYRMVADWFSTSSGKKRRVQVMNTPWVEPWPIPTAK